MKTPTNTSRDLLLLSMIAHSNKKYDTAGSLFAAALSSADVGELVNVLQAMTDMGTSTSTSSDSGFAAHKDNDLSLPAIASILAAAMEEEDESQEDDAEDVNLGEAEEGDGEEDDGEEGSDTDPESEPTEAEEGDGEEEGSDADEEDEAPSGDDGDDSTDDMDPDSPGDTLMPSSISTASTAPAAPGIVRVLAKRSRPDTETAPESDDQTVAASDGPTFTSVLPAGRSPVTVR